jgi:hypothetical protein
MSDTPRKPGLEEPETEYLDDERPLTDAERDAWIERNKDALNASIEKAHQEYLRGECRSLDEVMAEIEARAAERERRRKASPK